MTRDEIPHLVEELLRKPARWAVDGGQIVCWYDGLDQTLEVFNASASEQRPLLSRLRPIRSEIEQVLGVPLVVIFHTPEQTDRLYPEFSTTALEI